MFAIKLCKVGDHFASSLSISSQVDPRLIVSFAMRQGLALHQLWERKFYYIVFDSISNSGEEATNFTPLLFKDGEGLAPCFSHVFLLVVFCGSRRSLCDRFFM